MNSSSSFAVVAVVALLPLLVSQPTDSSRFASFLAIMAPAKGSLLLAH